MRTLLHTNWYHLSSSSIINEYLEAGLTASFPSNISIIDANYNKNFTNSIVLPTLLTDITSSSNILVVSWLLKRDNGVADVIECGRNFRNSVMK